MTDRFESLLSYGSPPISYGNRETWTEEVRELYQRLEGGDTTALAPLLSIDLEFIRDRWSFVALVILKYDPEFPPRRARAELQKVTNVIRRRPGKRRAKLPRADRLQIELAWVSRLIKDHHLLQIRDDRDALEKKVAQILWAGKPELRHDPGIAFVEDDEIHREISSLPKADGQRLLDEQAREEASRRFEREARLWESSEPGRERLKEGLLEGVRTGQRVHRTPRSWALETIAHYYGVDAHLIEKLLGRERARRKR